MGKSKDYILGQSQVLDRLFPDNQEGTYAINVAKVIK